MMKYCVLLAGIAALTSLAGASSAVAQNNRAGNREVAAPVESAEMWFYQQQLKRYDDPKMAVRRKAEFRAQQRQLRLAAMKWYGFIPSRPAASHTPFTSMYGAKWQGNYSRPYAWFTGTRPTVILSTPR